MASTKQPLLSVRHLSVSFFTKNDEVKAVDDVSFSIPKGQTLGIVGESGAGKSMTALSLLRLSQPGEIVTGEILFEGENILKKKEREMRKIRGKDISMIFQDPMNSLHPTYTIGQQLREVLYTHEHLNKKQATKRIMDMLQLVGISAPEKRMHQYPHELSGGMKQRAMIAMALLCYPKLLIADEPTTALDVTIQAQILTLIKELQRKLAMSVLIISHDFGVIAEMCDHVAVMYGGNIVEMADVHHLFEKPKHPYTIELLQSLLRKDRHTNEKKVRPIKEPFLRSEENGTGCRFAPKCPYKQEICAKRLPPLIQDEHNHYTRCWIASDDR
ncbi:ABC transporter ATP-binding protein [Aliibacillus thermotolerans]|uniref:ABC transporter ATP-binding protein n=1 Tax=Aliibacillus thermotolerans TaxID=1834418 RepID=A0ABW0U5Q5_9BACI|nr:ABC transporter ATP-binding protein [Aliibacillus thermotolerans]MDA3128537.1 ATP-binding cassette domain-containing protein [Aliibacillus thermotolerans]